MQLRHWLGLMVVALAFACGPLGVHVKPDSPAPQELEAAACQEPGVEIDVQALLSSEPGEEIIPLNTRGYNYVRPGTGRPAVPSRASPH